MKETVTQTISSRLTEWWNLFVEYLPNILLSIVVLVVFIVISRLIRSLFVRILKRTIDNQGITKLVSNIMAIVVLLMGLFLVLSILDLNKAFTSLLAGAGIAGLALGLAFQEPIINLISGIDLASRKTYEIGDLVETNGYVGFVERITLRTTLLKTLSGQDLIIPNKMIAQSAFINYTFTNERRIELTCGIAYDSDLEKVERVALKTITELEATKKDKEILFYFTDFGGSSIDFVLQFWCDTGIEADYLRLRHQAIMALKSAFNENDISIPYPTRTLQFSDPSQLKELGSQAS